MNIKVKQYHEAEFRLSEDGDWLCIHNEAYVEPPCCNGSPDEYGRYMCGCDGKSFVLCPAINCTGIQDWEIDELGDMYED